MGINTVNARRRACIMSVCSHLFQDQVSVEQSDTCRGQRRGRQRSPGGLGLSSSSQEPMEPQCN